MTGKTSPPNVYPFTPGWEGSGTIAEVGKDHAEKGLVGKRVGFSRHKEQGYTIGGAMAEFAVTDINSIIPLRDETSLEEAVALYVNPLTCLCMIDRCKKLGAKAVIISAAASQLGRMMIKYCMKEGLTPIGTVRRQEQADMLKSELGAQYVFCSQDPDFAS